MIRHCDGTDVYLTTKDGEPCSCGLVFDDVARMVIFPHPTIVKPSEQERAELLERAAELRRRLN